MNGDPQGKRDELVTAALIHVAFDGWSMAALGEAARDIGLESTAAGRVFPGGAIQALAHFVDLADRRLAEDYVRQGPRGGKMDERMFQAIRLRLEPWGAHREAIRRAVALLALPQNLPLAARLTWGTADALWQAVGDKGDRDMSWATKRGSLAAVYSATLFYWLDDSSEGSTETWAFLRRRLRDIQKVPRLRQRVAGMIALPGRRSPPPWARGSNRH